MRTMIEYEFDQVYGLVRNKKETTQQFLTRLVEKVNKTTDDDWDKLTADAQRWFNTAFHAWEDKETIPDFPDAEGDPKPADERDGEVSEAESSSTTDESDDGSEDEMARRRKKRQVAAKPPAKKRATNGNAKLGSSGAYFLKKAMLKKMNVTDEELSKILKDKDYPLSPVRISIIRNEFRHTMRLLQEEGQLKNQFQF